MTLSWMQRIDAWLGLPLVWLLKWFTPRAKCLLGDRDSGARPRRVICAKFIGIGSVVLSLPMLKALKDAGVEIAFWSFPSQAEFLRLSGLADHIWIVRPTFRSFLPTLIQSWWQARRFKADVFFDLEPTANFSTLLARLTGAPRRVGFLAGNPQRESLYTHLVALTAGRHMVESCLLMVNCVGLPAPAVGVLPVYPGNQQNHSGRFRVVMNINTSDLGQYHRKWPNAEWRQLCGHFLNDSDVELIFPGSRSEEAFVRPFIESLGLTGEQKKRVINLAGRTKPKELMDVLAGADLVVSVDSGIMHLAAWAGTPVVGLFGPETPSLYAPRSTAARVVWAALPCSPCCTVATEKHTRCLDNQCMKRISHQEVLRACQSLLKQRVAA